MLKGRTNTQKETKTNTQTLKKCTMTNEIQPIAIDTTFIYICKWPNCNSPHAALVNQKMDPTSHQVGQVVKRDGWERQEAKWNTARWGTTRRKEPKWQKVYKEKEVQIRFGRHNTNDSTAPVASPRAPAASLVRQAVLPERTTLVNDSPFQSTLNKPTTATQDDNKMTSRVNFTLINWWASKEHVENHHSKVAADFWEHMSFSATHCMMGTRRISAPITTLLCTIATVILPLQ